MSQQEISEWMVAALNKFGMDARVAEDPSRIHVTNNFDEWTVHLVVFRHNYEATT
jgi:hypothetical protein